MIKVKYSSYGKGVQVQVTEQINSYQNKIIFKDVFNDFEMAQNFIQSEKFKAEFSNKGVFYNA